MTEVRPGPAASDPVVRSELAAALRALEPRLREPLLLVEVTGLSYREAADVLGVPEGTVKSRVHSARQRLLAWWRADDDTGAASSDGPSDDERGRAADGR